MTIQLEKGKSEFKTKVVTGSSLFGVGTLKPKRSSGSSTWMKRICYSIMKKMHEMNEVRLFQADPYFLLLFFCVKRPWGSRFTNCGAGRFYRKDPNRKFLKPLRLIVFFNAGFGGLDMFSLGILITVVMIIIP